MSKYEAATEESEMAKKMNPLTTAEKKWIDKLQAVLAGCPSKRFTSYTIGDAEVTIYDKSFEQEVSEICEAGGDVCQAVSKVGCELATLKFPFHVQSTAG